MCGGRARSYCIAQTDDILKEKSELLTHLVGGGGLVTLFAGMLSVENSAVILLHHSSPVVEYFYPGAVKVGSMNQSLLYLPSPDCGPVE